MRARGNAVDTIDRGSGQTGTDLVAGRRRCDVRTVSVGIARRHELIGVEIVCLAKAIGIKARADDLVVAGLSGKMISNFALTVPIDGRVIGQDIVIFAETAA